MVVLFWSLWVCIWCQSFVVRLNTLTNQFFGSQEGMFWCYEVKMKAGSHQKLNPWLLVWAANAPPLCYKYWTTTSPEHAGVTAWMLQSHTWQPPGKEPILSGYSHSKYLGNKDRGKCSTYRELWEIVVVQVVVVEHWLPKQSPGFDSCQLPDVQFALFKMSETHSMANGET